MLIVINGAKHGTWKAELINEVGIFVSGRALTVKCCVEVRIIDMKLIGADSNNGTCSDVNY